MKNLGWSVTGSNAVTYFLNCPLYSEYQVGDSECATDFLGEIASVDGGFCDFGARRGVDKGVFVGILREIFLAGTRKANAEGAEDAKLRRGMGGLAIWGGGGVSSQPMKTYLSYARFTYAYWWQPAALRSGAKV